MLVLTLVFISLIWISVDRYTRAANVAPHHELAESSALVQPLALVTDITLDLPPVLSQDQVVFVGRQGDVTDAALTALDVTSGAQQWQLDAETLTRPNGWLETWPWSPPFAWRWSGLLAADGLIYVADAYVLATNVRTYDIHTGQQQWQRHLGSINGSDVDIMLMTENQLGVRVNEGDFNAFYLLNQENGYLKQKRQGDAHYIFWMDEDPQRIYEASSDTVNVSQYAPWRQFVGGCGLAPQVADTVILLLAQGCDMTPARVVALDRQTGEVVWEYEGGVVSNVAINGRTAAFFTITGRLLIIDVTTGQDVAALTFTPGTTGFLVDKTYFVGMQEDLLAVYFSDSQQFYLFRINTE